VQSFKLKFIGITILQGIEFPNFLLIFASALQQCSAAALPVMTECETYGDLDLEMTLEANISESMDF